MKRRYADNGAMLCKDCYCETSHADYYMVTKAVWTAASMYVNNPRGEGFLCISCLERRLGRELVRADFIDAPVNTTNFQFGKGVYNYSGRFRNLEGTLLEKRLKPTADTIGLSPVDW